MTVLVYSTDRDIWDLRSTRISGMPTVLVEQERTIVEILNRHNFTYADIASPSRFHDLGDCRAEIAYYLRDRCHWSFPRIGKWMRKDHSSIIAMLDKRGLYRRGVTVPIYGTELVRAAKECPHGAKKASRILGIHHRAVVNIRRGIWDHVL